MDALLIEREALQLPTAERARLAQHLIDSLDELSVHEADTLWLLEASERLRTFDAGGVTAVLADEVRQKARALLK
mgnify:FL=1